MKIGEYDFPENFYYEKNHFWAKDDSSGNVIIGASDFSQQLAGEIIFVKLPMEGTKLEQGKSFSFMKSVKWEGKVFAPFSGEVIEVNEELKDSPELINDSPYDKGWIVKIKPSDFDGEAVSLMKTGYDFKKFIEDESKNTQKKIKISIEPIGKRLLLESPTNGLKAIRYAGIGIKSVCASKGTCGKCRILIMDKDKPSTSGQEEKNLAKDEIEHGVRLACQQVFDRDIKIYIPASSLSEEQKLQVKGKEREIEIDPPVIKYHLKLKTATLDNLDSDFKRIKDELRSGYKVQVDHIDLEVLKLMSHAIRKNSWEITVAVRENEVISIEGGDTVKRSYGIAVDLGTTKIALLLVDLGSGKTVDSKGIINPQISYGEDVMSRLNYAIEKSENLENIKKVVIKRIGEAVEELCSKNDLETFQVLEMTVVGNTAMHHLFLGLPVKQLALSPFVSLTEDYVSIKARDLGISLAPGAYVYMLPPIAGFVGSDHLAMVLATGLGDLKGNYLGIDIGTNTEIALSNKGSLTSVSTASGPAFEGAHIKHGMRAAPGAIERVVIEKDTFMPRVQTIKDKPAIGVCGSGILDAVAELLRTGAIDKRGKFQADNPFLCSDGKDQYQFVLARSEKTGKDGGTKVAEEINKVTKEVVCLPCGEKDISVNQKDIVEIQLAKGAMRAGIEILLENAGIDFKAIDGIIIAGAFGSYIDPRNVVNIGMFPMVSLDKISQVGNAASVGAKMVLISMEQRRKAEEIAGRTDYLELTVFPSFSDHFISSMQFPDPGQII